MRLIIALSLFDQSPVFGGKNARFPRPVWASSITAARSPRIHYVRFMNAPYLLSAGLAFAAIVCQQPDYIPYTMISWLICNFAVRDGTCRHSSMEEEVNIPVCDLCNQNNPKVRLAATWAAKLNSNTKWRLNSFLANTIPGVYVVPFSTFSRDLSLARRRHIDVKSGAIPAGATEIAITQITSGPYDVQRQDIENDRETAICGERAIPIISRSVIGVAQTPTPVRANKEGHNSDICGSQSINRRARKDIRDYKKSEFTFVRTEELGVVNCPSWAPFPGTRPRGGNPVFVDLHRETDKFIHLLGLLACSSPSVYTIRVRKPRELSPIYREVGPHKHLTTGEIAKPANL
ncbi:hypothetical protein J6590_021136 [Homalodisca vitripennis]|nr:hypothetical protein J6590_021136 [Homalodisca vitripennis]